MPYYCPDKLEPDFFFTQIYFILTESGAFFFLFSSESNYLQYSVCWTILS